MEITDIKNAVADRANGYSDIIAGSLRSIAESLNGRVRSYADDAAEAVPELPGMSRNTSYTRMGMWFGLGIALAGAAVYAWQEYRRTNAPSAPLALLEAPKRNRKPAPASSSAKPKAQAASSASAGTVKRSRPAGSTAAKPTAKRKPRAAS